MAGFPRQLTKLALYVPRRQVVLWMSSDSTGQSSSPQNTHSQLEKFATWRQQCLVIHIFLVFHIFMTIFSQRHIHVILSTALTNLGFTSALQVKLRKLVLISLIWLNHGLWALQIALCSRSKKWSISQLLGPPRSSFIFASNEAHAHLQKEGKWWFRTWHISQAAPFKLSSVSRSRSWSQLSQSQGDLLWILGMLASRKVVVRLRLEIGKKMHVFSPRDLLSLFLRSKWLYVWEPHFQLLNSAPAWFNFPLG